MSQFLGVVADGFTGALMVAGYIESARIYCPVVSVPPPSPPMRQ